ncbi:MAG: asparagine synthase (glutamine-hydrolyzing), partial [Archangium sp.]|nr:asparagine synthase (glutamine-hydrolyzing) [Archangium sp.]
MCGIAGILNLSATTPPSRDALEFMAGALEHRGPDEFGLYLDRHCGLAHSRLSIIDLSTGQQPLSNEDGTLWISFNGEIFNYVELRAELEALGHTFRTKSDTEVIVHAWEAWGEAAFERMNGQWAVALWDEKTRTFVLTRDRVGVRPLFMLEHEGRLFFASEVKSLFAGAPGFSREIDPVGLDETFTFWTVVPPQSVFKGVRELEPGHVAVWRDGRFVHDVAYWSAKYPVGAEYRFNGTLDDATQALAGALENATKLRMVRADVPVGSYLSGGLDSSLVAAMAARAKPSGFKTFSLRFADAEYDETPYQRAMVQRLGTEHAEVVVSRKDIADVFPKVIRHTERPILRTAPAPLFLLSKLVHDSGIKVVLT